MNGHQITSILSHDQAVGKRLGGVLAADDLPAVVRGRSEYSSSTPMLGGNPEDIGQRFTFRGRVLRNSSIRWGELLDIAEDALERFFSIMDFILRIITFVYNPMIPKIAAYIVSFTSNSAVVAGVWNVS